MKNSNNPELGDEVIERVTGFKGIITSYAKCLTGCDRITVRAPLKKDGTLGDEYWFDIYAVKVLKKHKVKPESVQAPVADNKEPVKTGGPPVKAAW